MALEKNFDERNLLAREPPEPTVVEVAFDCRVTPVALEARNAQRLAANRAMRRSLPSHGAFINAHIDKIKSDIDKINIEAHGTAALCFEAMKAIVLAFVVACGTPGGAADGGADASSDVAVDALAGKSNAVNQTIASNALCTALPNFYWEIGDKNGVLLSGKVGALYDASTKMDIASASKLVFGAYVVEKFDTNFGALDGNAMRMLSGYVSFEYTSCVTSTTVSDCFSQGDNAIFTAADVGMFDYGGGHFQKYAIDLGLGDDDNDALATEMKTMVGTDLAFTYSSPQLAAGINTSASDYGAFLRKILSGTLAIHDALGVNAVCTLPSSCPTAVYSPAPAAWHYSYAHWVEDDPTTGDGAFSSPGAFGFYPWIDATKTYYGILARYSLDPNAYIASAECGAVIRKAFVSGQSQ